MTHRVAKTRRVGGDSQNQEDGCPSYSRSHNTRQRPQEGSVLDRRCRIIPEVVFVPARGSWGSGNLAGGGFG